MKKFYIIFFLLIASIILVITGYIIPDVDISIMSSYELAIYLTDNLWNALVTIGTIAAACGAFYAARVSLSIRDQEKKEKIEDELQIARLFLMGIYFNLNHIKEQLNLLDKNLNETKAKSAITDELISLLSQSQYVFSQLPKPTKENITLLKPLPYNLASKLFQVQATLSLIVNLRAVTPEILSIIRPSIAHSKMLFDEIFPEMKEEAEKSEQ
ncbi:hypothetical protein NB643_08975 [Oxalobacter aliiformigenes]|uniref:Uncharacterized protein n=1 Tax=Oxalobacter aliiformigenes TaxID=2946593 RepID=A0ABY7JLX9_9BURK|nr:hypothetical protein [Oxalobacter aliiformigenes]WAV93579.1 hypothetical protein NB641_02160 [Oxalobacter aliiformigenes]WAV94924.1 hypothetical protein NB643_08975 [Oxalobacter aliiformigenes]WAV97274.1 hypothetical protein NB645_00485 [Oxalobacter aliiformigenes]